MRIPTENHVATVAWGAVVWLMAIAAPQPAVAQPTRLNDPEVEALAARLDAFFGNLRTGQVQQAYDDLLRDSQLLEQREQVERLVAQTRELPSRYGNCFGHEFVQAQRVGQEGKDLILIRYLYKCERFPVIWHLAFYRRPSSVGDPWRVILIRFDTHVESLFDIHPNGQTR
jgi:hypothetical protein